MISRAGFMTRQVHWKTHSRILGIARLNLTFRTAVEWNRPNKIITAEFRVLASQYSFDVEVSRDLRNRANTNRKGQIAGDGVTDARHQEQARPFEHRAMIFVVV